MQLWELFPASHDRTDLTIDLLHQSQETVRDEEQSEAEMRCDQPVFQEYRQVCQHGCYLQQNCKTQWQVCTCDITAMNIVPCKFILCIQILSLERKRGGSLEGGGRYCRSCSENSIAALYATICMTGNLTEPMLKNRACSGLTLH